ncbi:MAG TPA: hypothetical protein DHM37_02930, partial [Candidatus Cloacimonas sp.]|nr:hypothetical protein [Candidatus Cloacimonas sp.]
KLIILLSMVIFLTCNAQTEEKKVQPEGMETLKAEKTKEEKSLQNSKNADNIEYLKPFDFTKGLYLSAFTVGSNKFETILDSAQAAGINTVVFDLKNMKGRIFFSVPQKDSLRRSRVKPVLNVQKTVKALHRRNMRAVARVVMFHDRYIASRDSTIRPRSTAGGVWQEYRRHGPSWLDPSLLEVQAELLSIVEEAAKNKVDEIQLDYVRFPTQGKVGEAEFDFMRKDSLLAKQDSLYKKRSKIDIITEFTRNVKNICNKYNITLSADVFAIVAWQRAADVENTGQDIARMTKNLDFIHPMIYSSHFSDGFGFRRDVANEPYHIVYKAAKLTKRHSSPSCRVAPYIQANRWRVNYKPEYIYAQLQAIEDLGLDGFILWDAANNYFDTLRWIRERNNSTSMKSE